MERLVPLSGTNWDHFGNEGSITIGVIASVGEFGILSSSEFYNDGPIKIDSCAAGVAIAAGYFYNYSDLTIGEISPISDLIVTNGGNFVHEDGIVKGTGNISSSGFLNSGGTLSPGYSPGKMTFTTAETFANSTLSMEVTGGGGVGGTDFDQISVNGVATLSATTFLSLNFSYPTVNGTTYDILTATSISGTIPSGNISFTNSGSGNVAEVTLSYPGGNIVRVTVSVWTGPRILIGPRRPIGREVSQVYQMW